MRSILHVSVYIIDWVFYLVFQRDFGWKFTSFVDCVSNRVVMAFDFYLRDTDCRHIRKASLQSVFKFPV